MTPAPPSHPVPRLLASLLQRRLANYPVVVVTGPRQSGKTTLARATAPNASYLSLEDPDTRAFAADDPRGFLRSLGPQTILDEVQRCPSLFSYLQGAVDADPSCKPVSAAPSCHGTTSPPCSMPWPLTQTPQPRWMATSKLKVKADSLND
jgi:predicted AAA+ superfamily ATPase